VRYRKDGWKWGKVAGRSKKVDSWIRELHSRVLTDTKKEPEKPFEKKSRDGTQRSWSLTWDLAPGSIGALADRFGYRLVVWISCLGFRLAPGSVGTV